MEPEHESRTLRVVLVSMRDRDDPMAAHEVRCFKESAGLTELQIVYAIEGGLGERELEADLLLFGGSGAYSVLEPKVWIRELLEFLPRVLERKVPAWASCFAFQGLAMAMGGRVVHDDGRKQLGACAVSLTAAGRDDVLFASLPSSFFAQFGHQDHVLTLPSGVAVLATGNGDDPQAFRVDGSRFWGAQFHPELDKQSTLDRWIHYRARYEGDNGDEIDRHLREADDTPHVKQLLRGLVALAREDRQS